MFCAQVYLHLAYDTEKYACPSDVTFMTVKTVITDGHYRKYLYGGHRENKI